MLFCVMSSTAYRLWIAALVLALVATRLAGLHLHLCTEAIGEGLAGMHVDAGAAPHLHHQDDADPHVDAEVDLLATVVHKLSGDDLPALILAAVLLLLTRRRSANRLAAPIVPVRAVFHRLRPPLRAPPLILH
jgi:hypothetical protein